MVNIYNGHLRPKLQYFIANSSSSRNYIYALLLYMYFKKFNCNLGKNINMSTIIYFSQFRDSSCSCCRLLLAVASSSLLPCVSLSIAFRRWCSCGSLVFKLRMGFSLGFLSPAFSSHAFLSCKCLASYHLSNCHFICILIFKCFPVFHYQTNQM